ncbi:MAG: LCP family protein [Clostridia bacterium]|nr:LCP family protein [Clostridia bacterium]
MNRNWDRKKRGVQGAVALLIAAVILALLYQGGLWLERRNQKPETRGDYRQRYAYDTLVEYDGVSYRERKNLTTILLMGIDRASGVESSSYRNGGQADFLRLLVIDSAQKRVSQIQIDRDTMTPITVLGVLGNQSGIRTSQICLSHGFGDGKEQSCELTANAVSNLLFGTAIDFYIAMNLDGISVLNDMAGGVTVTLEDDFSALDPTMTKGTTLTLMGEQAEYFVRSRMNIGVGTNEARMKRQQQYIAQLTALLDGRMRQEQEFVGTLYDQLEPYLITNISRGRLINEAWASRDYERAALIEPEGTHEIGADGFMQFHIDETALQQEVLELFYDRVE